MRVELKCSHHSNNNDNMVTMWGDGCTNSPYCGKHAQHIHVSNYHVLHLKLTQYYRSIMSQYSYGETTQWLSFYPASRQAAPPCCSLRIFQNCGPHFWGSHFLLNLLLTGLCSQDSTETTPSDSRARKKNNVNAGIDCYTPKIVRGN